MTVTLTTKSWLDDIVDQHSELESPLSFWRWGALASIAAVVKDNVWLDRQIYKLYPNIYVMFHAESGLKKGPPISMAKQLVKAVNNTRVISGRSSIQGILKDLGTGKTLPGGKVVGDASAFICSSELSSSIVEDKVATTILTDLYDRQYNVGEWRSLLKMETFQLKNPTISMLTATNEAHSTDFFGRKDVQGGYFARTFIIYENIANRSNALLVPLKNPPNYEKSAEYLKQLSQLKGAFEPLGSIYETEIHSIKYYDRTTNEKFYLNPAGYVYQEWYDNFKEQIKRDEIKDETGTLNRFGDSVLKVAMLMSLARAPELKIDEQSMSDAIASCEKLVGNIRKTTLGQKGLSTSSVLKTKVIEELFNRTPHMISRPMLMKKMWMHYSDISELDNMMSSFHEAGLITTSNHGTTVMYTMPDSQIEEWTEFFSGKIAKKGRR